MNSLAKELNPGDVFSYGEDENSSVYLYVGGPFPWNYVGRDPSETVMIINLTSGVVSKTENYYHMYNIDGDEPVIVHLNCFELITRLWNPDT